MRIYYGISQPEVVKLVRKGLPTIEGATQKQTRYYLPDAIQWYLRHKAKSDSEKDEEKAARIRKLTLEADRIELELSERRQQVIEVVKIAEIWGKVFSEFKTNLLLVPKSISALFDSFRDEHDLEESLYKSLSDTLEHLSRVESLIGQVVEEE